jgi:glycosidase
MFEFHVSRLAREKYDFDEILYQFDGNIIFPNFLAVRKFTETINQQRDLVNYPEQAVHAGEINAIGLIDEILHYVNSLYRKSIDQAVFLEAYQNLQKSLGKKKLHNSLTRFTEDFPPAPVYKGEMQVSEYLKGSTNGTPNTSIVLEEMMMLWITNQNPAVEDLSELFDDSNLQQATSYREIITFIKKFFKDKPSFGPDNQDLYKMLRSPAVEEPYSLLSQLEYIRRKWGALLGNYLYRLLSSVDLIKEETRPIFAGPGSTKGPSFDSLGEEENFSPDSEWMPRTVMMAKNTYVWLYQLSEKYGRQIIRLDQIPSEELDTLAGWGFNGLWLIGLWERSKASKRIKQLCGNPEAVASAYSLENYKIADDLGGEEAYLQLRERAWQRGIRLASDMVPNHMGIDSDWVLDHPEWFISLPYSPFPAYSFNGPDLSPTDRVTIKVDDHYFDRTDAAVVFLRRDNRNGETRFVYHGNDGTSMPWNDTAQLNYLKPEVREAVIQTILHVARKFPIIRFDAAMTLAKKHYQRLWFPQPGSGGDIPSRSEFSMTKEAFDDVFPKEFWREVVDRVTREVPETLLLAEAFWMMEGFFVRTLGMHRVYNSAFMNMLRNEENEKYRIVIKNTLEFDPQILKRYVNFMNNPDEKTAVEQFGKGDKYFGICTLMATMPGLPMFGHGQIEGFAEKYGMEYFRPYWDENPDMYLVQRHQRDIFPLLKKRDLFAGVKNFLLFDFHTGEGRVYEDVFAYLNGNGNEFALVVFHNHYGATAGWIHHSARFLNKGNDTQEIKTLYDGIGLQGGENQYLIFREQGSDLEFIRSVQEINQRGLFFTLNAYECHVFLDFRQVIDDGSGQYKRLNTYLGGRGVPSIDSALKELILAPILNPLSELANPESLKNLYKNRHQNSRSQFTHGVLESHNESYRLFMDAVARYVKIPKDLTRIVREEQRGLEALLQLPVFEKRYPFPGSERYEELLNFINQNLNDYPFIWFVLILWNDLRLMGRVITNDAQYVEISRSWLDEWGIARLVQRTLKECGLDFEQAQSGVKILRLLIDQQNWTERIQDKTPRMLMESWLSLDDIRNFIAVNRHQDKLWFNKESFESLLWWLTTTALIRLVADPEKSLTEDIEILMTAYDRIEALLIAEEDSEYQVVKLLEALK